jgi:hypothetical protein
MGGDGAVKKNRGTGRARGPNKGRAGRQEVRMREGGAHTPAIQYTWKAPVKSTIGEQVQM